MVDKDDKKRRKTPDASKDGDPAAYAAHKEDMRKRMAAKVAVGNDIDELPPVKDPERRERCRLNLLLFGETYLRKMFRDVEYAWADFHHEMTATLQKTFLEGGLFAEALPRGSAKTGWCKAAVIWGAVYGHTRYTALIDASETLAIDTLDSVKTQLEVNKLLLEDFPEVCIPIRRLEGKAAKCKGQTFQHERTRVEWRRKCVVIPTIPGSDASGHRMACSGLTGAGIRGLVFTNSEGEEIRPDVAICNDIQTDKSAISAKQCKTRLKLVQGAVANMGGPGQPIAVVAAVTVIAKKDAADQLLESPDWQGMRHGILTQMPKNMRKWAEYREIQIDSLNRKRGVDPENEFYRANQEVLDAGTKATWPDRYDRKKELSGIQAAMNLYYKFGAEIFWAEHMNDPQAAVEGSLLQLDPEKIRKRVNGRPRYEVPLGHDTITVGVDIQLPIIFYWVTAYKSDFTGAVIDIGTYPDQGGYHFTNLTDLAKTLQFESGAHHADINAAVRYGLEQIGKSVLDREYVREDGVRFKVKRAHFDINWEPSETAVAEFCRDPKRVGWCFPARGRGRGQGRISSWKEHPGEKHPPKAIKQQCEWMFTTPKKHLLQECYCIKSFWQSRLITAFSLPIGSPGSICFWGNENTDHLLVAEHLTAHNPQEQKKGEDEFIAYIPKVGASRWDFLDCGLNSMVAASVEGIQLSSEQQQVVSTKKPKRKYISVPDHMKAG